MSHRLYNTCVLKIFLALLPLYNGFVIPTNVRRSPFVKQPFFMTASASTTDDEVSSIFSTYSNEEGLMMKETLIKIPLFAELVSEGDLLESELDRFWDSVPKASSGTAITIDSFLKIYQSVDDLFEEVDEETDVVTATVSLNEKDATADSEDLKKAFDQLCDDDQNLTKEVLLEKWDEMVALFKDGLISEEEFDGFWDKTSSNGLMTFDGFIRFNTLLDELFEFEDDDEEVTTNGTPVDLIPPPKEQKRIMIQGDDLPPAVLFSNLANSNNLVGMKDLAYWKELQDMIKEGDLLKQELKEMFGANAVKKDDGFFLTEEGFVKMYDAIDDLFEEDEENGSASIETAKESGAKRALMDFFDDFEAKRSMADDADRRLSCGLDADEADDKLVERIVSALEKDPINIIQKRQGDLSQDDFIGDWQLLYSTSSAMKFNKGLSGLGGSFPNGKFGGLKQTLKYSKFMQDVEYYEQIEVNPSSASFEVKVNGAWELRKSTSLFTNQPCTMLYIEPDRVQYGPTSTRADHWKSLGPLNMLDITYLDDDLRIMRGNTATDAIFVFQRIN